MSVVKNEIGHRYGRLVVVERVDTPTKKRAYWKCLCDCGNSIIAEGHNLRLNNTKSCGCLQKDIASSLTKELHPNWKGGRLIRQGYVLILMPEHPRADKKGYVKEHILVMENMLGGPLPEGAEVHHNNLVRSNNWPYNLRLFKSKNKHIAFHRKLQKEAV